MFIKFYEELFSTFKDYLEKNSKYSPKLSKNTTLSSTYFPTLTFQLTNYLDTDNCSLDKIEKYDQYLFTINIYTKDIISKETKQHITSQVINDELTNLTINFFGDKLNMRLTSCTPTPNLDTNILRRTIQFQYLTGNATGNIIRR